MRTLKSKRPSPAMVVALIALVAALGGTAYAAYPHQATKKEQILISEKILADQGAGAWTCSPGTGLSTDHTDPYPPTPADPGMPRVARPLPPAARRVSAWPW